MRLTIWVRAVIANKEMGDNLAAASDHARRVGSDDARSACKLAGARQGITLSLDDRDVRAALQRLIDRARQPTDALREIGEVLVPARARSSKERVESMGKLRCWLAGRER